MPVVETIPLHETARERYLTYALSVITSRALPDVRDGLKPVQRRILYAMYTGLRLGTTLGAAPRRAAQSEAASPTVEGARHRKSATIVGETMGKYHPHGDTAIYDAMVRMAQPWALRAPLVDGQGNFGSLDGDNPAAMRYTEARLTPFGTELLGEIRQDTVAFRPTYDGQLFEPVVLPATAPLLLVNGATGIAVGMATNIPPHNLGETVDAALALLKTPGAPVEALARHLPGPDFPTGGRILNTPAELLRIYQTGEGPVDLRGEWIEEPATRTEPSRVILTSVPYALDKSDLIEKIADHIRAGRVPQIVDVRDESTDDVRVVLELRKGASAPAAMAYLLKHTPLQSRFHVNLTCLVPTDNPEVSAPQKVDLKTALQHFLDFRLEVVTRRLAHELRALDTRIHILRGFAAVFSALDEALKMIRAARDRADANARLRHRFSIDEEQADAVLDIKLYRLARMEIDAILKELAEKEARAAEIRALLNDEPARWGLVRTELRDVKKRYADERRSTIGGPDRAVSYAAEDYIVSEDVYVIVTRDGWVKRQRSYTDLASIRVREGDRVLYALAASTRSTIGFFTSAGRCYTARVDALPQTTGHGDPVQKFFDFADRETVVGVVSFDGRTLPEGVPDAPAATAPALFDAGGDGAAANPNDVAITGPYVVAVSSDGLAVRFETAAFSDLSNKNGRVFMRLRDGVRVVGAEVAGGGENVCLASRDGRALIFPVGQVPVFRSAAKGVIAMRLAGDADAVLGMAVSDAARRGLDVETSRGRTETVRTTKFDVSNRGNRGQTIISKGTLKAATADPVELHLPGRA
ncbi:MAG TPA: DNA topoisomerase (ATP-hydrolyzing) [Rubricoccaceae bacterium]|jgi:DNA gyrase subunit A